VVLAITSGCFSSSGSAPGATARSDGPGHVASYDLEAAYPNFRRAGSYFLRGMSRYASPTSTATGSHPTSLWFKPLTGGAFEQFNTSPYRDCHSDLLRWSSGGDGVLRYYETHADCFSDHAAIVLSPGVAYMPNTWTTEERWTRQGVSLTRYSEDDVPVCAGSNAWRSRVVGLATMPNGETAVHTQTNERQVLVPIAGAPESAACPPGRTTAFDWQENFYIGAVLVRTGDGSDTRQDVGLIRSAGGNVEAARQAGHPQWDVVFSSWDRLPPGDAGTMTTTTTAVARASSGNTIAFTYTPPRAGVRMGSVSLEVPSGWTAPVTLDAAGCTTSTAGEVTTSGQTIRVSALTLPPGGQAVITYGATSGGSCEADDGAIAPQTTGSPVWQAQATPDAAGTPTSLPSSPSIQVTG
jgi:hypothetical protein